MLIRFPAYDDIAIHDPYYRSGSLGAYPPLVHSMSMPRRRRSSSVHSYSSSPAYSLRRGVAPTVKFKRKGAFRSGITLGEAQANVRLSGWDSYTFSDLNVDVRGKIYVNIRVGLFETGICATSLTSVRSGPGTRP
jgi:hypothetical protein